jgi:hypothetical protein
MEGWVREEKGEVAGGVVLHAVTSPAPPPAAAAAAQGDLVDLSAPEVRLGTGVSSDLWFRWFLLRRFQG